MIEHLLMALVLIYRICPVFIFLSGCMVAYGASKEVDDRAIRKNQQTLSYTLCIIAILMTLIIIL